MNRSEPMPNHGMHPRPDHGSSTGPGSPCLQLELLAVPRLRGTHSGMNALEALDKMNRLLDSDDGETVNTSMRLPVALRDAAALAVAQFGAAPSTTHMTAAALRSSLETVVMEEALRLHYEQHPDARPSLAEVALALAVQDGSPLADKPDLVERAALAVAARRPDADDVLLWAEAQLAGAA